jgi:hypothetical protein
VVYSEVMEEQEKKLASNFLKSNGFASRDWMGR